MYGPGAGYNVSLLSASTTKDVTKGSMSYIDSSVFLQVFAGKDASRGLGKSSLKPEDAVSDYSTLTEEEMGVLNDWFTYFSKRYNIVGKVAE